MRCLKVTFTNIGCKAS